LVCIFENGNVPVGKHDEKLFFPFQNPSERDSRKGLAICEEKRETWYEALWDEV
jgi:hypothetical protein